VWILPRAHFQPCQPPPLPGGWTITAKSSNGIADRAASVMMTKPCKHIQLDAVLRSAGRPKPARAGRGHRHASERLHAGSRVRRGGRALTSRILVRFHQSQGLTGSWLQPSPVFLRVHYVHKQVRGATPSRPFGRDAAAKMHHGPGEGFSSCHDPSTPFACLPGPCRAYCLSVGGVHLRQAAHGTQQQAAICNGTVSPT